MDDGDLFTVAAEYLNWRSKQQSRK